MENIVAIQGSKVIVAGVITALPRRQSRIAGRCGISPHGETPRREKPWLLSRGALLDGPFFLWMLAARKRFEKL